MVILSVLVVGLLFPKAAPLLYPDDSKSEVSIPDDFSIVAIGDSLTEGIGDQANSQGYLPLVKKGLESNYNSQNAIATFNYGKKGNRTPQLTERIQENKELQADLAEADIILITIGGNDLVKVLKDNLFDDFSIESFDAPKETYEQDLTLLYETIRKHNLTAPIYHLGIYNPFYLNFPEITELQDIVNSWNETTQFFVETQENSFFIPINDLIYQGNGSDFNSETENDLLSEDDSFHPNSQGYQVIATEFTKKIISTQYIWQEGN